MLNGYQSTYGQNLMLDSVLDPNNGLIIHKNENKI